MPQTNEQMLSELIELAVKHNFKFDGLPNDILHVVGMLKEPYKGFFINGVLTNHEFAEAIYGEEFINVSRNDLGFVDIFQGVAWLYHLQKQLRSDDPLKYMWEHRRK